jgi:hypothetical protein
MKGTSRCRQPKLGGEVRRNRALNCWPWVRSLTHSPDADPLAGRNGCGVANHGHHVTMAAGFGAQNAKPILGVMVGYALN